MRRVPGWAAALFVGAAVVGACTDVGTSPDAIVALAFDTLPYPSVVAGDTMRDSMGRAAPLRAVAYDASGDVIENPSVRYLALDTGVDIGSTGYLVASTRIGGTVRVVAAAASLQSLHKTVTITHAPEKLTVSGTTVDTLKYVLPDALSNTGKAMTVKLTRDSAGAAVPVPGFLVSWLVTYRGKTVEKSDTTLASLWDDASSRKVSLVDTTGADGTAARTLRIRSNNLPASADSFLVAASVRYRGAVVAGSPVKFVIHFRPKTAR
ncbi:MAG: hypothetical protein P3B98_06340 [Gemmatimonadota bacterium]|nr:hypothetical protein [Gemmatimonadota bacterium]